MAAPPQDSSVRRQLAAALIQIDQLRRENAALRTQLAITSSEPEVMPGAPEPLAAVPPPNTTLSSHEKVAVFGALFKGRTDVFPIRWENKAGKSGYSPACGNEWRPGICEKPRIKCSDCPNQQFLSVTDKVLFDHLAGTHTTGVYPLLPGDVCHFLAVDFDDADWRADTLAFRHACDEFEVPAHIEISRSGNGAHVWIFFAVAIGANLARQLGTALITHTSAQARQLKLSSYDRLFPSQDTLPKGGFGNLIGEGFDHARLDTLLLAMPISWKGTLQQYAGRLHRQHALKDSVRIYDYIDASHPQLARMWERRKRGYRAMGYAIEPVGDGQGSLPGFEHMSAAHRAV